MGPWFLALYHLTLFQSLTLYLLPWENKNTAPHARQIPSFTSQTGAGTVLGAPTEKRTVLPLYPWAQTVNK